jgi:hypothetical protein
MVAALLGSRNFHLHSKKVSARRTHVNKDSTPVGNDSKVEDVLTVKQMAQTPA